MCKRCDQQRQEVTLKKRRDNIKEQLLFLLTYDIFKGSEYMRLQELASSSDLENLVLVEQIIEGKLG